MPLKANQLLEAVRDEIGKKMHEGATAAEITSQYSVSKSHAFALRTRWRRKNSKQAVATPKLQMESYKVSLISENAELQRRLDDALAEVELLQKIIMTLGRALP